jgi:hypothetical protein
VNLGIRFGEQSRIAIIIPHPTMSLKDLHSQILEMIIMETNFIDISYMFQGTKIMEDLFLTFLMNLMLAVLTNIFTTKMVTTNLT